MHSHLLKKLSTSVPPSIPPTVLKRSNGRADKLVTIRGAQQYRVKILGADSDAAVMGATMEQCSVSE